MRIALEHDLLYRIKQWSSTMNHSLQHYKHSAYGLDGVRHWLRVRACVRRSGECFQHSKPSTPFRLKPNTQFSCNRQRICRRRIGTPLQYLHQDNLKLLSLSKTLLQWISRFKIKQSGLFSIKKQFSLFVICFPWPFKLTQISKALNVTSQNSYCSLKLQF